MIHFCPFNVTCKLLFKRLTLSLQLLVYIYITCFYCYDIMKWAQMFKLDFLTYFSLIVYE